MFQYIEQFLEDTFNAKSFVTVKRNSAIKFQDTGYTSQITERHLLLFLRVA